MLALLTAFGPFAALVLLGPDASFHASGFIVGGALLVTAGYVLRLAPARKAGGMAVRGA